MQPQVNMIALACDDGCIRFMTYPDITAGTPARLLVDPARPLPPPAAPLRHPARHPASPRVTPPPRHAAGEAHD